MLSGHSGILLLTPVERKNIFFSLLFFSEHLSVHRGMSCVHERVPGYLYSSCVHSSTVSIVQGSRLAVPVTDAVVPAPRPTARPVMDASYRCTDREYRRNFATDAAIVATCERVCNFLREEYRKKWRENLDFAFWRDTCSSVYLHFPTETAKERFGTNQDI